MGEYITNKDVILDTLILKDTYGTHGTHCASIAAGTIMDYKDQFTGKYTKKEPLRYGAGKINAYKGLLYVLDLETAISELPQLPAGVYAVKIGSEGSTLIRL